MIEESGIPTASITMLREVTEKVNAPRALFVDTPLGYPLGRAHDVEMRREIVWSALSLLNGSDDLPVIKDFPPFGVRE